MAEPLGNFSDDDEASSPVVTSGVSPNSPPVDPDAFDPIVFTPDPSPGAPPVDPDAFDPIVFTPDLPPGGEGSSSGGGGSGAQAMPDPQRQLDFEEISPPDEFLNPSVLDSGGLSLLAGGGGQSPFGFSSSPTQLDFSDDAVDDAMEQADNEQTWIAPVAETDGNGDVWVTFRDARTRRVVRVSLDGQEVDLRHFGQSRWHTLPPKKLNDRMPTKRPLYELGRVLREELGYSAQIISQVSLWDLVTRGANSTSLDKDVQEYLLHTEAKLRLVARLMQRHKYPPLPMDRKLLRQKYRDMANTRLVNDYAGLADGKARDALLGGSKAELETFFTTEYEVTDYERYAQTRTLSQLRALQGRLMALARGPGDANRLQAIKTLFVEDLKEESIFSRDRQPDALDGTGEWTQQDMGPLMITLPNGKRERILSLERRRVDLSRRVHNRVSEEEERLLAEREDILQLFSTRGPTQPRAGLLRSRLDDVEARLEVLGRQRTSFIQARAELQQQIANINDRIEAIRLDADAIDFRDNLVAAIALAEGRVNALNQVIEIDPVRDARSRAEIEALARATRGNRAGARLNLDTLRRLLSYYDDMVRLYWEMRERVDALDDGTAAREMYAERKRYADELDDVDEQLRILRNSGLQHDITRTHVHSADVSVNRGLGEAPLDVTDEYMRRASGMTRVGTEMPMYREDLADTRAKSDGPAEFLGRDPTRDWGLVPVARESIYYPADRALEWECCGQIGVEAPGCWAGLPDPKQTLLVPSRFYDPRTFPPVRDIANGQATLASIAEAWKEGVEVGSAWCPPGGTAISDHVARHRRIVRLNAQIAPAVAQMAMQSVLAESISAIEFSPAVLTAFKELYALVKLQNHAFNLASDGRIPPPSASDAVWKDFIAQDVFLADLVPCVMRQEPRPLTETCEFPAPLGSVQFKLLPTALPLTPAEFRVSVLSIVNFGRRLAALPGPLDQTMPESTWALMVELFNAAPRGPAITVFQTALSAYFSVPGAHAEFTTSGADVARMDQLARLIGGANPTPATVEQREAIELAREWTVWREDATEQVAEAISELAELYNGMVREVFCSPNMFRYAVLQEQASDPDSEFETVDDFLRTIVNGLTVDASDTEMEEVSADAVEGAAELTAQAQALFDRYRPEYREAILRARLESQAPAVPSARADARSSSESSLDYLDFAAFEEEAASNRPPVVSNTSVVTMMIPASLRFQSQMPIGVRYGQNAPRGGGGGRQPIPRAQLPVYTCGMRSAQETTETATPEERQRGSPERVGFYQLTLSRARDREVLAAAISPLRLVDLRRRVTEEVSPLTAAGAGVSPQLMQRVVVDDADDIAIRALEFMERMLRTYVNRDGQAVEIQAPETGSVILNTTRLFTSGTGGGRVSLVSEHPNPARGQIALDEIPSRSYGPEVEAAAGAGDLKGVFTWKLRSNDREEFDFLKLFSKLIQGLPLEEGGGGRTPLYVPEEERGLYPERYAVWKVIRRHAGYSGIYGTKGSIAEIFQFPDSAPYDETRVSKDTNALFIGNSDKARALRLLSVLGTGTGRKFLARQLLYVLENWRRFAKLLLYALNPDSEITPADIEAYSWRPYIAPITNPLMMKEFRKADARGFEANSRLIDQLTRMQSNQGGGVQIPFNFNPQRDRVALNEVLRQYALLLVQAFPAYQDAVDPNAPLKSRAVDTQHPFVVQRNELERLGQGGAVIEGINFPMVQVFRSCLFSISRVLQITRVYPSLRDALLLYTTGLYLSKEMGFVRDNVVLRAPGDFRPPPAQSPGSPPNAVELAPARVSGVAEIVDYAPLTEWYFQAFTRFGELLAAFVRIDVETERALATDEIVLRLRESIETEVQEGQQELERLWENASRAYASAKATAQRTEAETATYILAGEPTVFLFLARGIFLARQLPDRVTAGKYITAMIDEPNGPRGPARFITRVLEFIRDYVYKTLSPDQQVRVAILLEQLRIIRDADAVEAAKEPRNWNLDFYVRPEWLAYSRNDMTKQQLLFAPNGRIYINSYTEMYRVHAYINLLFSMVYIMIGGSSLADSDRWIEGVSSLPDIHGRWSLTSQDRDLPPLDREALKRSAIPTGARDPVDLTMNLRRSKTLMTDYATTVLPDEAAAAAGRAIAASEAGTGFLSFLGLGGETGSSSKAQAARGFFAGDIYVTMDRVNALLMHSVYTSIENTLGYEQLLVEIANPGVTTHYSAEDYDDYYAKYVYTEELLTSYALALKAVLDVNAQADAVAIRTWIPGRGAKVSAPRKILYNTVSPGWGTVQRLVLYRVARATGILYGNSVWTTKVTFTPTQPGDGVLYVPKDRYEIQNLLASWALFARLIMMVGDRGWKIGVSAQYSMIQGQAGPTSPALSMRDLIPKVSEEHLLWYLRQIGPIPVATDVEIVGSGANAKWIPRYGAVAGVLDQDQAEADMRQKLRAEAMEEDDRGGVRDNLIARIEVYAGRVSSDDPSADVDLWTARRDEWAEAERQLAEDERAAQREGVRGRNAARREGPLSRAQRKRLEEQSERSLVDVDKNTRAYKAWELQRYQALERWMQSGESPATFVYTVPPPGSGAAPGGTPPRSALKTGGGGAKKSARFEGDSPAVTPSEPIRREKRLEGEDEGLSYAEATREINLDLSGGDLSDGRLGQLMALRRPSNSALYVQEWLDYPSTMFGEAPDGGGPTPVLSTNPVNDLRAYRKAGYVHRFLYPEFGGMDSAVQRFLTENSDRWKPLFYPPGDTRPDMAVWNEMRTQIAYLWMNGGFGAVGMLSPVQQRQLFPMAMLAGLVDVRKTLDGVRVRKPRQDGVLATVPVYGSAGDLRVGDFFPPVNSKGKVSPRAVRAQLALMGKFLQIVGYRITPSYRRSTFVELSKRFYAYYDSVVRPLYAARAIRFQDANGRSMPYVTQELLAAYEAASSPSPRQQPARRRTTSPSPSPSSLKGKEEEGEPETEQDYGEEQQDPRLLKQQFKEDLTGLLESDSNNNTRPIYKPIGTFERNEIYNDLKWAADQLAGNAWVAKYQGSDGTIDFEALNQAPTNGELFQLKGGENIWVAPDKASVDREIDVGGPIYLITRYYSGRLARSERREDGNTSTAPQPLRGPRKAHLEAAAKTIGLVASDGNAVLGWSPNATPGYLQLTVRTSQELDDLRTAWANFAVLLETVSIPYYLTKAKSVTKGKRAQIEPGDIQRYADARYEITERYGPQGRTIRGGSARLRRIELPMTGGLVAINSDIIIGYDYGDDDADDTAAEDTEYDIASWGNDT